MKCRLKLGRCLPLVAPCSRDCKLCKSWVLSFFRLPPSCQKHEKVGSHVNCSRFRTTDRIADRPATVSSRPPPPPPTRTATLSRYLHDASRLRWFFVGLDLGRTNCPSAWSIDSNSSPYSTASAVIPATSLYPFQPVAASTPPSSPLSAHMSLGRPILSSGRTGSLPSPPHSVTTRSSLSLRILLHRL
jgi:hypothetical protein